MRKDIILALGFMAVAAAVCACFATMDPVTETTPPAEPAAVETNLDIPESPPAEAPAFDAPLSDLVQTLPPDPDKPKADVVVRVKLPPPDANYCPADPNGVPACDPNRPLILF